MAKILKPAKSINTYYSYGTLFLTLATVAMTLHWNSNFGILAYLFMAISLLLFILGRLRKDLRLKADTATAILSLAALLVLVINIWILASRFIPQESRYYLYYPNYWQGWPSIPLSLVALYVLAKANVQPANKLVFATSMLIVATAVISFFIK